MPKGKFIVFEGIDGSGTETQSKRLFEYLLAHKTPANKVSYPDYEGPFTSLFEDYLYKKIDLNPETQLLIYATDMAKDREQIATWLSEGRIVIADRYLTSALAYQGANGLPVEFGLKFARLLKLPKPDVVFFLNVSPATSISRKLREKTNLDRHESNERYLKDVNSLYKKLATGKVFGEWKTINAEISADDVFQKIKDHLGLV
ncbi:MAG: dTMP kinase [Nanoarchaeota archaeon]|nr:dTMP kinase [Nanoarchaeota archaeon]